MFIFLIAFCSVFEFSSVRALSMMDIAYTEVIGMYTKEKAKIGLGTEKLRNRFIRLLRSESTQAFANNVQTNASDRSIHGTFEKDVSSALLEAESRKAQIMAEIQRHPHVY